MRAAKAIIAGLLLFAVVICPSLQAEDTRRVPEDEAKRSVTSKVNPEYPPMARQMKLGGRVQLDAFIDADGNVEKVQILTGNPLLTTAAASAVKRWKFSPFLSDGKATKAVAQFTFNFTP